MEKDKHDDEIGNTEAEDDMIKDNCKHFREFLDEVDKVGAHNMSGASRRELEEIRSRFNMLFLRRDKETVETDPKTKRTNTKTKTDTKIKDDKDKNELLAVRPKIKSEPIRDSKDSDFSAESKKRNTSSANSDTSLTDSTRSLEPDIYIRIGMSRIMKSR